jgi:hypothetical protein
MKYWQMINYTCRMRPHYRLINWDPMSRRDSGRNRNINVTNLVAQNCGRVQIFVNNSNKSKIHSRRN